MLIPTEDDDAEAATKAIREDEIIGKRQEIREIEAEKKRSYSKGWKEAEEKIREANRSLLEASQSNVAAKEIAHAKAYSENQAQRRTPPPEKPVQGNAEQPQTKSWQDVICTYGKKDGPLRGTRLGDLDMSQLQFLYTMFGKPDLSQINPKDRLLAVAIRDWNASLEKEEEVPF
jgi:hypothetical protein